jgi:hypothetical protein
LIVVAQELCETDDKGNNVKAHFDARNTKSLKVICRRLNRVFMNYTLIKRHSSPDIDFMYLVTIKKERRHDPNYWIVLYNGKTNEIHEVSRFSIDNYLNFKLLYNAGNDQMFVV